MTTRRSPLRKARALISDPKKWTTGHLARDKNGRPVEPDDKTACRFCALGAIEKTYPMLWADPVDLPLYAAAKALGVPHYVDFNDAPKRTHDEVLWAFDLAIAFDEVGYP